MLWASAQSPSRMGKIAAIGETHFSDCFVGAMRDAWHRLHRLHRQALLAMTYLQDLCYAQPISPRKLPLSSPTQR